MTSYTLNGGYYYSNNPAFNATAASNYGAAASTAYTYVYPFSLFGSAALSGSVVGSNAGPFGSINQAGCPIPGIRRCGLGRGRTRARLWVLRGG